MQALKSQHKILSLLVAISMALLFAFMSATPVQAGGGRGELPNSRGTVGIGYSYQLDSQVRNGPGTNISEQDWETPENLNWSCQGDFIPGLTLDSSGLIHGTPTTHGRYNIPVRVEDSNGHFDEYWIEIHMWPSDPIKVEWSRTEWINDSPMFGEGESIRLYYISEIDTQKYYDLIQSNIFKSLISMDNADYYYGYASVENGEHFVEFQITYLKVGHGGTVMVTLDNPDLIFDPPSVSVTVNKPSADSSTATPGTTSRPSGNNDNRSSGSDRGNSSPSVSTGPVNVTSATATTAVNSALSAAKTTGASKATANIKNPGDISLSTLKAMANQAGTTPLKLQADSMSADGRSVDVRITLDPKLAAKNLNLSASTTNAAAKSAEAIFEKSFSNNVSVVSLGQKGSFGQPVEIAAKIDPALDTTNLVFYSYNSATNSYKLIPNSGYWVDKNGYVHFTTKFAGDIIITDKPLAKK